MITAVVLVLAVFALVAIGRGSVWTVIKDFKAGPVPEDWGADPDDLKWDAEADEQLHKALGGVQDIAKRWGETIAGLLGIFGVVAFVKGPEAFKDVPGDSAWIVVAVIALAAIAAATAVYTGALAAQGSPQQLDPFNGWTLKQLTKARTARASSLLRASRTLALSAAVLLFAGMVIAWTASLDERGQAKDAFALVVWGDDSASCGKLVADGGQPALETDTDTRPLTGVRQVVKLEECPAE